MKHFMTIALLLAAADSFALDHRFYSVEADGDTLASGIEHHIETVTDADGVETVRLYMRNDRKIDYQPVKAGIKLGIDTYMDSYPEWYDKYFPTLAVCEPTHFYGYMQSPGGKVKVIVSADSISSWSLDYNLGYMDPEPHWFYGHRINSLNLDVLCRGPLPEHHPVKWRLRPGEEMTTEIKIIDIDSLDSFEEVVYRHTGAPVFEMERTSVAPGETISIGVWGKNPKLLIDGQEVALTACSDVYWEGNYSSDVSGIKQMEATEDGRVSHGTLAVRHPWRETIRLARKAADTYKQKATSHVESWYGYHSAFEASRLDPEPAIDSTLNARFDRLYETLFNPATGEPYKYSFRIQNVASTIGMLADRYEAYGNPADLDKGAVLAAFLMSNQREDGAFMNWNTDYTSVIYPAKSLLELADAERAAGRKKAAKKHETSARKAILRLAGINGDFNTEGQLTYEDGMVSCSALQIGALALRTHDKKERARLTKVLLNLLEEHNSLTQTKIADGRRRGGTLRFWESQYDVHMLPNMMTSPHGWSAWRAYATYYAFLLTGEERWLRETFDAASAFTELIDWQTGELRWAFVVDPFVEATQISEPDTSFTADMDSYGTPHPDMYPNKKLIVGEQYVPMISDWQTIVSSDNDVHECFKFIAEAVLRNAFLVGRPDGSLAAYNCSFTIEDGTIKVTPSEPQINTLYTSLPTTIYTSQPTTLRISFPGTHLPLSR